MSCLAQQLIGSRLKAQSGPQIAFTQIKYYPQITQIPQIKTLGKKGPQTCPVKCLPNEMFTPLNAELIHLGRSLFHRGFAETSAADLTGVSQSDPRIKYYPQISQINAD